MNIEIVKVGQLECNCYILEKDNNVLIIDPGDDYNKIKEKIKNKNLKAVLITHNHFDHIGALNNIKQDYQIEIYDNTNLEEKEYKINNFSFKVIKTYGHSSDSISFYFEKDKVMFVGDFIFKDSIGRCDLPTGNINDMKASLDKIKKYDDNIIIYPGHGNSSTLGNEKKNNIYFKEDIIW